MVPKTLAFDREINEVVHRLAFELFDGFDASTGQFLHRQDESSKFVGIPFRDDFDSAVVEVFNSACNAEFLGNLKGCEPHADTLDDSR